MNIGKVSLKEWILRAEFWANTYMTKIAMKISPFNEKSLSEIIKIDKPHEKGFVVTLFKLFTNIFIQYSMLKSYSSIGTSSIYVPPTLQVYKKTGWVVIAQSGKAPAFKEEVLGSNPRTNHVPSVCRSSLVERWTLVNGWSRMVGACNLYAPTGSDTLRWQHLIMGGGWFDHTHVLKALLPL